MSHSQKPIVYSRLQNIGSKWPSAFSGISAQIKSSNEYLDPETQNQISMPMILKIKEYSNLIDQEKFGVLILKWSG